MSDFKKAVLHGVRDFMGVKEGENLLIVIDESTVDLGNAFKEAADTIGAEATIMQMKMRRNDGAPLPKMVAEAMKRCDAVIGITKKSMTHTEARHEANKAGVKVGTLPNITPEIIERCLSVDKNKLVADTEKVSEILQKGKVARITTPTGTDLTIPIDGIDAICSTGVVTLEGKGANIISGEGFLMPEEGKTNGVAVADGSIAGIGLLNGDKVTINIKDGFAVSIEGGGSAEKLKEILKPYGKDGMNIAELGVGTNYKAKLSGFILEDEKVGGTVHIALGNNASMGGSFNVGVHIDCVMLKPTLYVDDTLVLEDGQFQIF